MKKLLRILSVSALLGIGSICVAQDTGVDQGETAIDDGKENVDEPDTGADTVPVVDQPVDPKQDDPVDGNKPVDPTEVDVPVVEPVVIDDSQDEPPVDDDAPDADGQPTIDPLKIQSVTGSDKSSDHLFAISGYVDPSQTQQVYEKIDYSVHGANWPNQCTSDGDEQSPLNLSWEDAELSLDIHFDLLYEHKLHNATVQVEGEGSIIRIDYPNVLDNEIRVVNELAEEQTYHLSHMLWKVPSEHTIDNRQLSAELQIFHVQYATNRQVAFSILFDKELSLVGDSKLFKTCFFEAFNFADVSARTELDTASFIDVPLKEFIEYLPNTKFAYYYGSETHPAIHGTEPEADCHEAVTWIVNLEPSLITEEKVNQLKSTLSKEIQGQGGNYRNIQPKGDRTIYKFANTSGQSIVESKAMELIAFGPLLALTIMLNLLL